MKYVYFGSPRFAEIVLEQLIDAGMPPATLVCNPDRPFGRKRIITPPATKILVSKRAKDTVILQPEKPADALETLRTLGADFFVVAAYARIIPENVLSIPRLGTLGVHPSLLPKYRGASPIQSAILNGEKETGITIYLMDAKMDHGPMIGTATCTVEDDDNYVSLEGKLARLGGALLAKTIPAFIEGTTTARTQNESEASYTKKFTTEDGNIAEIDLQAAEGGDTEEALAVFHKIKALNPEPGAWTIRNGRRVKLLAAKIENGRLVVTEIQNEGDRPKII